MEIQELISRARIVFSGATKRFEAFNLVNGKNSTKDISVKMGRTLSPTLQDLQKMRDLGLINAKLDSKGNVIKKDGAIVYEKVPTIRHLSKIYFQSSDKIFPKQEIKMRKVIASKGMTGLHVPSEQEILSICNSGESQIYEFKSSGVEVKILTKECCAFANTKLGGLIFYGIEDDGIIAGSDKKIQDLDQPLQNSIKNTISPSLTIEIAERDVFGQKILIIKILPWNKKDVFQYEGRVYLRKGTNVFVALAEDTKKLHKGQFVV